MTATGRSQSDVYVLDTSALLRLYLADGPMPPSLEPAIQRGCSGDALLLIPDLCLLECASVLLKQVQRHLLRAMNVEPSWLMCCSCLYEPPAPAILLQKRLIKP